MNRAGQDLFRFRKGPRPSQLVGVSVLGASAVFKFRLEDLESLSGL